MALVSFGSMSTVDIKDVADKCITACLNNNIAVVYCTSASKAFGNNV